MLVQMEKSVISLLLKPAHSIAAEPETGVSFFLFSTQKSI